MSMPPLQGNYSSMRLVCQQFLLCLLASDKCFQECSGEALNLTRVTRSRIWPFSCSTFQMAVKLMHLTCRASQPDILHQTQSCIISRSISYTATSSSGSRGGVGAFMQELFSIERPVSSLCIVYNSLAFGLIPEIADNFAVWQQTMQIAKHIIFVSY